MITGNVRAMLRDSHFRGTMRKWGLEGVVLEMLAGCAMWEAEGVPFLLEQRHSHRGPRSWALSVAGQTYHLRPVKTKLGYRMALKDSYHRGEVVAKWATAEGVQHWFDVQGRRAERIERSKRVQAALQEVVGEAVAAQRAAHA